MSVRKHGHKPGQAHTLESLGVRDLTSRGLVTMTSLPIGWAEHRERSTRNKPIDYRAGSVQCV